MVGSILYLHLKKPLWRIKGYLSTSIVCATGAGETKAVITFFLEHILLGYVITLPFSPYKKHYDHLAYVSLLGTGLQYTITGLGLYFPRNTSLCMYCPQWSKNCHYQERVTKVFCCRVLKTVKRILGKTATSCLAFSVTNHFYLDIHGREPFEVNDPLTHWNCL